VVDQIDEVDEEIESGEKYIAFLLGDEKYCLPITSVQEILKNWRVTRVPCAPAHLQGVTNVRGQIIGVINLRQRLGLTAVEAHDENRLVLTHIRYENETVTIGLVVDQVDDIVMIHENNIAPASNLAAAIDESLLVGGASVGRSVYYLLNLPALF
jgi:purine-binding chemotaxis protein CheW